MRKFGKKELWIRVIACIIGNLLIALGVALAKIASLGNDPFNGMCMSVSAFFHLPYTVFTWSLHLLFFLFEILWGRKYIHIGTFINWFLISFAVSGILSGYDLILPRPDGLSVRIVILVFGLVICSLGLAVYQTADLGVAPYDALPIIFCDRFKKFPFFWARMIEDSLCVLGIVFTLNPEEHLLGIGTLLFALGLGPIIHLFMNLLKRLLKNTVLFNGTDAKA